MDFMVVNRALFELFVEPCLEENEDFDSYTTQMRKVTGQLCDGTAVDGVVLGWALGW